MGQTRASQTDYNDLMKSFSFFYIWLHYLITFVKLFWMGEAKFRSETINNRWLKADIH